MSDQLEAPRRVTEEPPVPRWAVLWLILLAVVAAGMLVGGVVLISVYWLTWPAVLGAGMLAFVLLMMLVYAIVAKLDNEARQARDATDELTKRILEALGITEEDPNSAYGSFVRERFKRPLLDYSSSAPRSKRVFTLVTFGSIVTALATSGLAVAAPDERAAIWVVFGLGLLGGTLSAINQVASPQKHATARYRASRALRREGWGLALGIREYCKLAVPKERFQRFACRVDDIVDSVEATDEASDTVSEPRGPQDRSA